MSLQLPSSIRVGDTITAEFLNRLVANVRAQQLQSSADHIIEQTANGTTIRSAYGPKDQKPILFGLVQSDFTTGTQISVKHCDGNGVTEGDALNVKVYAGGGSANLGSVTVAGASASVSCKLATGKIIAYSYSDGTAYLVGDVAQIVFDVRYDATSHKLQAKFYWRVGIAVSSVSDWADVRAYSAVTAITAWQVDSTSGEIQKKTQAFYSPEVGAESAWTKIDDTQESDYVPCS
jgi:hypothetical protein